MESMLGLRGPPPSDLHIATPWAQVVGDCGARAVRRQRRRGVGGYHWQKSRCQCDCDACECEKRPANEHNNGLFKLIMGGTALSASASTTVGYTSRCR